MFKQHAARWTTHPRYNQSPIREHFFFLRCCGWGVVTWKFTEPVYESRGLWCNCEACCILWAWPFCQRSKIPVEWVHGVCALSFIRFFFSPPGKFQHDISRLRTPPQVGGNLQFWSQIKNGLYKPIFCLSCSISVQNGFLCQQESLVLVRALSFERKRPTKSKPNRPKRLVILLTSRCVVLLAYEVHPLK